MMENNFREYMKMSLTPFCLIHSMNYPEVILLPCMFPCLTYSLIHKTGSWPEQELHPAHCQTCTPQG